MFGEKNRTGCWVFPTHLKKAHWKSSPNRGEKTFETKNMECVFKISGKYRFAKQISNSKNLEQLLMFISKIMAQLLIDFPLEILPFPVSFAGAFLQ